MRMWQLQEAKAHLSEAIKKAANEGPQKITVHREPTAVVISSKEYERLKRPKGSFVEFMRCSPLYGLELDLRREQPPTREAGIYRQSSWCDSGVPRVAARDAECR